MTRSEHWDRFWLRRNSRRRFLSGGAAVGAGAVGFALVGCGDDDDDTNGGGDTPTAGATNAPTATPTASTGSEGIYGGTFSTSTLDPHRGSDPMINTLEPVMHTPRVYSWTHRYNVSRDEYILDMATSIEAVDETTVLVKIRPDIQFHDVAPMDGRIVTAEDLAYTYRRFPVVAEKGSPINPQAWNWMDLDALEVVDDTTLRIPQKFPMADNLRLMAQHFYGVVAMEADQAAGGDLSTTNTAGCGPYILTESDPSVKMVWTRNPNYFSHDHSDQFWFPPQGGYPDAYEQRVLPDPSTTQAQLISGDLDYLYFNVLNVDRLLAQDFKSQGLQVQEGQANTNTTLVMNMTTLSNTMARKALMKAIDYDAFIGNIYLGDGELGAPVGNGYPDSVRLPREELATYLTRDIAEAKRLWEASGETKTSFVMLGIANFPFMEAATSSVKQSIEEALDITIEIQAVDIPSWIARARSEDKDWDFLVQFSQSTPDVPTFNILATFDPNGTAASTSLYKVDSPIPEVADLAKQAAALSEAHYSEVDAEARVDKLHAFQRFALENAAPGIPLPVRKIDWLVTNPRIKNVPVGNPSFFRALLVDNMWIDPSA